MARDGPRCGQRPLPNPLDFAPEVPLSLPAPTPTQSLSPWQRALLGALGFGAALGLACAPVGWHGLQWVGMVPLLWAWEPLGKGGSCLAGLLAGLATQLALFTWLAPAFAAYAEAPVAVAWLGFGLYALWEAVPFAILGLLDWAFRKRCPRWRWWLFAAALVGLEWLWPRVFAWRAGAPQVQAAWIAPLAALLGPLGLTLLVAFVNGGLYEGVRRRRVLPPVLAALALGGALSYGAVHGEEVPSGPTVRIGWVQPGVVSRRGENANTVWRALEEGCRAVGRAGGADLCVLPEGISPEPWMELDPEANSAPSALRARWAARLQREQQALLARIQRLSRLAKAPVLIGLTRRFVVPHGQKDLEVLRRNNACLLVGPEGLRAWTGKRRLLPFAEELPSETLRPLVPMAGRYTSAEGSGVLSSPAGEVGVLVCYEAIWTRPFGAKAPAILVNPTNDDWFTGQGPALHAMLSRLRSLESNRPLVRVAATGISFVQSGAGERLSEAKSGAGSGVVTLQSMARQTPLTRWGTPWAPLLGLLALTLPLAIPRAERERA